MKAKLVKFKWKHGISALLVIIALICMVIFYLKFGTDWRRLLEWQENPPSYAMAVLFMTVLPLFGFPIFICYCLLGYFYSPLTGIAVGVLSLSLNMTLGYAISRYLLRESISKYITGRWKHLLNLSPLTQIRTTILIRTIPGVPYWLQNYILGIIGVPLRTYLTLSLLFQSLFLVSVILTIQGGFAQHPYYLAAGLVFLMLAVAFSRHMLRNAKNRHHCKSTNVKDWHKRA